jgi:hypothetical protein
MALLELLETLWATPQLQILRVQHYCAVWDEDTDATGTEGPPLRMVMLPHLFISFRDTTPRHFVLLIRHIDAAPTVHRHLFWRSWAVAPVDRRPVRRMPSPTSSRPSGGSRTSPDGHRFRSPPKAIRTALIQPVLDVLAN